MNRRFWIILPALLLLALGGCETVAPKDEAPDEVAVEDQGTTIASTEEARTRTLEDERGFRGNPLDDPASPLAKRIVYFDFDSAEVVNGYRPIIEAHAAYLSDNPGAAITLEGHTDERGSREYNLGLGERRGHSVGRTLVLLGATDRQVQTVSYGEEKPATDGHGESAWELNRRVEIIYQER